MIDTLPSQIAKNIRPETSGCWTWTNRPTSLGYGRVQFQGRSWPAHRLVYELLVGPIPLGLEPDHLCRNRICVNPAHIEPVTHRENTRRGTLATRPTCKNGHPWTPENTGTRPDSWRRCRACGRDKYRRFLERQRAAS